MKMKKFLASVLAVLMAASSMSFIAGAQETGDGTDTTETVTITFDRQNGDYNKTDKVSNAATTAEFAAGEAIDFPEDPSYIYHTFKGWSTEKNGTVLTAEEIAELKAATNTTYYGVWDWSKPDDGTPLDSITIAKGESIAADGATYGGDFYDAVADVVYRNIKPGTAGSTGSANMYSGINYSIPGNELYMTALVRTNMTGATSVTAGIYDTWNKSGYPGSYDTLAAEAPVTKADEWTVMYLKNTAINSKGHDLGKGTHIDFDAVGNDPADDLENDYYDVAGMALFATEKDAKEYDIWAQNAFTKANVYFDAHLTEDDSDVYTEYPGNLENEGKALVGWTPDPTAEEIEYVDLTRLPIPADDVTYHAVWNDIVTINFYMNDGTEAIETLTLGKGASVTAPTFESENKIFLGWSLAADSNELVEVQATALENASYYAVWASMYLTKLVVNGNDFTDTGSIKDSNVNGTLYGINNLSTVQKLDITMPYGYPTSVIPTIEGTSNVGTVTYTAPEAFDGEGSVTITNDDESVTLPVKFTVADRSTVKDITITPTSGVISSGRGVYAIKNNTDKEISATKFIPIYSTESKYYEDGNYLPEKYVNIEGWGLFNPKGYHPESYDQYRALIYYDTGADGMRDVTVTPTINHTKYGTRGTLRDKTVGLVSGEYKTGRWEYVYFDIKLADDALVYGWTNQPSFSLFGNTPAKNFTDDVLYVAEITLLVDADEKYLQYKPVGLAATDETTARNDGTITGLTSDMEIAIGDGDYAAVTTFDGFNAETGVLSALVPGSYSVRYAGNDSFAASEAVLLEIEPDSVEIYFEDGDEATEAVRQTYEYNADITAPASPAKAGYKFLGWALGDAETAYDFADAKATAELDGATFNALWERITTLYVNGSAESSGDGTTADKPLEKIADAWKLISDVDSEIIITGDTVLEGELFANGGNVTIKGVTGNEVLTHNKPAFNGTKPGKVKFENITFIIPTKWDNFFYFHGQEVEFGGNITVPVDEANGKYPIVARAGGESGATLGRKIIIRSGTFGTFHLGSKNNCVNADVDFEYYGGDVEFNLGNDGVSGGTVEANGATMQNIRGLLEASPKKVYMQWVKEMTGALQLIANNGAELGGIDMGGIVPAGGTWIIKSAEGGRADFTDTIGTYKLTTDKAYAVITDKDGNATKYRMADGVSGDAELYGEEVSLELALPAGEYSVSYTDDGVSVTVYFSTASWDEPVELNAENNYTAAIPERMLKYIADNKPSAGYKYTGECVSGDGKYRTENGTITITEYTSENIFLQPETAEDDTLPFYHTRALYNEKANTLDVTVAVANGIFNAGTLGGAFDKNMLEFTGYTLADDISNDIGDAPDIVKDAMYDGEDNKFVLVWNAKNGSVDASETDADIITFHFNVLPDAELEERDCGVYYYMPSDNYDEYFAGGYYQVTPVLSEGDDQFDVKYVNVYYGDIAFELAPTEPATITVKVNMPDKAGATADDIAYLVYSGKNGGVSFIALEEAGSTEKTIEKVISDVFYVGETYVFTIVKNGYTGSEEKEITIEDGMILEAAILGGDIKESFTGIDENAVDVRDFGDGEVTLSDFVRVVRAFDEEAADEYKTVVDINEDGTVNVTDLNIVKANYGKSYTECVITVTSADGE